MAKEYDGYRFQIGARCNIAQYRMLKRCSEKQDATEWSDWRARRPDEPVWLLGAHLGAAHLKGVQLWKAHLEGADLHRAHLEGANLHEARLEGANLQRARLEGARLGAASLEGANLQRARLEGARLNESHLERANLEGAHLERADLWGAHLEGAELRHVRLEGARLWQAHLEGAKLRQAHLEGATFEEAHLGGANLGGAHLEGANFAQAEVNGKTLIAGCTVSRHTYFGTVGLDAARVEPGLKQLLEYNIRWRRWQEWFNRGPRPLRVLKRAVGAPFWWMSDYGRSTLRIIATFAVLALAFAIIYYAWALVAPPGVVTSLLEGPGGPIPRWLVPVRALYFSVVTMTTLGFGDMHADALSFWGHVLLMLQVLSGYVLLGALVTRFAVLFTAGGPSARLAEEEEGGAEEGVTS